jgi:hypothetical protein
MRKILPKNFVIRRYAGSFLTSQAVCITATRIEIPMVSGTNMK